MLENIGKKVKRIRKELGLGQKEINVSQTHLSQIETETITSPKENVLNKIAKSFDMSLDDLINNTNWKRPRSSSINNELGFSPVIVDVEVDDSLNITWRHKSFPLYNNKGEKNEFCQLSGEPLVTHCNKCNRQIEDIDQEYCTGCGKKLTAELSVHYNIMDMLADDRILSDRELCSITIGDLQHEQEGKRKNILKIKDEITKSNKYRKEINENFKKMDKLDKKAKEEWLSTSASGATTNQGLIDGIPGLIKKAEENILLDRFNIQVVEAAVKKLRSIMITLQPAPPLTIEETRAELYQQLSNIMVQYLTRVMDPFGTRGIMKGFTDSIQVPKQSTKSDDKESTKEQMEKVEKMNSLLIKIENMKDKGDPIKLAKSMREIMEFQERSDEEISDKSKTKKEEKE